MTKPARAVVVGLVERRREVLIARKKTVPGHFLSGAWHVPGGRVEAGETLEEAIRRELREEAGIDVIVVGALGEIDVDGARVHWFLCTPLTHDLKAGDDVVEVAYVTPSEALRRFPPGSTRDFPEAAKTYFDG